MRDSIELGDESHEGTQTILKLGCMVYVINHEDCFPNRVVNTYELDCLIKAKTCGLLRGIGLVISRSVSCKYLVKIKRDYDFRNNPYRKKLEKIYT